MPRYLLLFVLALIPVLALTGCPKKKKKLPLDASPENAVNAGRRANIMNTMKGIQKACIQYNATEGQWPEDMQALVDSKVWRDEERLDPWGNDYVIETEGSEVTVLTFGADGEPGGEGADTDYSTD